MPDRTRRRIMILFAGSMMGVALLLGVLAARGWFRSESPRPSVPPAEHQASPEDRNEWPAVLNGRGKVGSSREDTDPQRPMRPFQTIPSH